MTRQIPNALGSGAADDRSRPIAALQSDPVNEWQAPESGHRLIGVKRTKTAVPSECASGRNFNDGSLRAAGRSGSARYPLALAIAGRAEGVDRRAERRAATLRRPERILMSLLGCANGKGLGEVGVPGSGLIGTPPSLRGAIGPSKTLSSTSKAIIAMRHTGSAAKASGLPLGFCPEGAIAVNRLGILATAVFPTDGDPTMYGRCGFSGRERTSACAAKMLAPLALSAACLAFSPAGAGEAGAQPGGPRATASQGQGTANEAKSVHASSLPKLNPSETSRMLQPPHPRGSLNEEEYNAAKAAAARRGAAPPGPLAPTPANPPLPGPQRP
jgi:hypothetical protein